MCMFDGSLRSGLLIGLEHATGLLEFGLADLASRKAGAEDLQRLLRAPDASPASG